MEDVSKNYHSRLLDISKAFDKPIERLKSSHISEKYSNWIVALLFAPFRQLGLIVKVQDGMKKLSAESLTALTIPCFTFINVIYQNIMGNITGVNEYVGAGAIGFIAGYVLTVLLFLTYLLDFYSDHFHTGAYRVFRKQEYNMFHKAFLDNIGDFYFQGVYDYIGKMQTSSNEFNALSDKVTSYFDREKQQLELKFTLLQKRYNRLEKENNKLIDEVIATYDVLIEEYDTNVKDLSAASEYVIELIKDINNVLFRMRNGVFSSKDLNLVCGFTLHELRGKGLHKIEDVGTSGRTPKIIDIDDPFYENWGVVEVIKMDMKQPVINCPYEKHTIVSVKMNIDRDKQWVYNFHFDSDNQKVNHLLVKNDIIDSREVYRLIHALCLITERMYQTDNTTLKEAYKNG
ncbi:hypothetical protein [Litchfieldia alkalitelluris]|uniref:hypothetical protein n=1 Tax=Litchfieldia alkalitelluris TaxID=304268 RepID=UPI000995F543|nr:hypothetical protein [Litchfieldia alkalitelluris]